METGRDGESGVSVSVITLQEQEHGTEPELAPTLLLLAMEGSLPLNLKIQPKQK